MLARLLVFTVGKLTEVCEIAVDILLSRRNGAADGQTVLLKGVIYVLAGVCLQYEFRTFYSAVGLDGSDSLVPLFLATSSRAGQTGFIVFCICIEFIVNRLTAQLLSTDEVDHTKLVAVVHVFLADAEFLTAAGASTSARPSAHSVHR